MNQEKTKNFKRATAIKVHIDHLITGNYVKDDINNYVETEFGIRISRARILGTIVHKWIPKIETNEETNRTPQATIILDDGTDTIRITAWKEDIVILDKFEVGDIVDVIGRVRQYQKMIYIIPEIIRKVEDPNWELVRELEIIEFIEKVKSGFNDTTNVSPQEITESTPQKTNTKNIFKDKIVELIKELDQGSGVSVSKIKETSNIPDIDFQDVITELINEGTIYQPRSGKYKLL